MKPRTAVLGVGEVLWNSPVVAADDAGLRGDGFFETLLVHGGNPARIVRLGEHLDRFQRSADAFGTALDRDGFSALTALITDDVPTGAEAVLRLSLSRTGTGLATLRPLPESVLAGRDGLRVVALPRGVTTTPQAPWLLQAAKTSSYAVNSAALREAARRGAEDVLFVDADGFALEGATANLLWHDDGGWYTPPMTGRLVLPGTTLAAVREHLPVQERDVRPLELIGAEGVWLLSSLRGAAPVLTLDGRALTTDGPHGRALQTVALDLPAG